MSKIVRVGQPHIDHPVVALDGVEREVQAASAVEQAHVPGAQVADLLPALGGGGGALALLQGRALRPAGAVRGDFLPDGLAEAVPEVPAVARRAAS